MLGKQNKNSKINELEFRGNTLNNPKDIAEGFNSYFSNIGPDLASQIPTPNCNFYTYVKKATSEFAAFKPTDVNNVYQLLRGLSSNKATGIDKISCKILKIAAPAIADSLTYIFNQAITLSSFPNEWKMARVIPLYKSGHRNLPGNYRPISVLPTISKIMERILYNQLYVYLTLKKAFDTVDHDILLKKLELYGIKGQALNLLRSYLPNRHQKCQVGNSVSSEHLIKCGVPQGSILGPLLFLLYINDLPECLKSTRPRLFADDTNLTASGPSITDIENAVNSDLENLKNWLIANKLSLNVTKTEFMLIGSPQMIRSTSNSQPNILIENEQIQQVYKCKNSRNNN